MSPKGRRENISVASKLTENPYGYPFFQAVRLLERASAYNKQAASSPVARFSPPSKELVRFKSNQSLSFPASEIFDIKKSSSNSNQWDMTVNFMGLTGACGVLPFHYTELILQRLKMKDDSFAAFLNLFNHRSVSLFYQASTKYRLPIEYERKKLNPPVMQERDSQTQALLSMIGLGTRHLTNRQYTRDESLIYYSGLLTQSVRTTTSLKQILQHHFNIPVQIKEFIGQWQDLIDDVRTRLPSKQQATGRNVCLGKSVMLGHQGWFAQGKFRVILGPLTSDQLNTFAPGTNALKSLNEIVRFYAGLEYDYDFVIRIRRPDIPEKIVLETDNPPVLGWNTWLSSKPDKLFNKNETLDISVTANRFR